MLKSNQSLREPVAEACHCYHGNGNLAGPEVHSGPSPALWGWGHLEPDLGDTSPSPQHEVRDQSGGDEEVRVQPGLGFMAPHNGCGAGREGGVAEKRIGWKTGRIGHPLDAGSCTQASPCLSSTSRRKLSPRESCLPAVSQPVHREVVLALQTPISPLSDMYLLSTHCIPGPVIDSRDTEMSKVGITAVPAWLS